MPIWACIAHVGMCGPCGPVLAQPIFDIEFFRQRNTEILFSLVLFITNTFLLFEKISLSPLDEESCKLKPTLVKERKLAKK